MLAKLLMTLESPLDRLEKSHPVFSLILFQVLTAAFIIGAVGLAGLAGGAVIWTFYHLI